MAETHDLGRLYVHGMRVPWRTPPVQLRGTSHEVEEPWRIGHCVVLRLLFLPYAVVVGWWGPPRTREQMEADEDRDFQSRRGPTVAELREAGPSIDLEEINAYKVIQQRLDDAADERGA